MQGPAVAPENRPSVIRATRLKPAPFIAAVGTSISGIPGAPAGPRYLKTTTSPSFIFSFSMSSRSTCSVS